MARKIVPNLQAFVEVRVLRFAVYFINLEIIQ